MSVVLAVKDGDKILMAADSQFSRGGNKGLLLSPNMMKIWRPAGHKDVVMGIAGTFRDQNILSTRDTWYDTILDKAGESIDFRFVVREIVPEILNELATNGRVNSQEGTLMMESVVLFAKGDNCFRIDPDGAVYEFSYDGEASAVGSGSDTAMAAYNVLQDLEGMDIKEKLIRAVSQACQDDLYVNYPIIIMDTSSDKVEVFDGVELYSMDGEEEEEEKAEEELTEKKEEVE